MKLLPLLCLLSPWFGPGSAQEIRPGVVTVVEDEDALLPCLLGSEQKIEKFDWRKDNGEYEKKEVFFYDRGSHYNNGRPGQDKQFKDRVLFFEDELKVGNASIKIKTTRLEDSGTYTCVLFTPKQQEFPIRLNVDGVLKIRTVTGAAREPLVKPIDGKITWRILQCKVAGVPKPEVDWRNSAGEGFSDEDIHVIEHQDASGRFHVELTVNVTKTDNYTCVATQRDIFHQNNSTLYVDIPDVIVSEGGDAVLPCSFDSKKNIQTMMFEWKKDNKTVFIYDRGQVEKDEHFKERLSHFEAELKSGNASIKIQNTQSADSARYTCYFSEDQKSYIILHVVGKINVPEPPTRWIIGFLVILCLLVLVVGVLIYMCLKPKKDVPAPGSPPQEQIDELLNRDSSESQDKSQFV